MNHTLVEARYVAGESLIRLGRPGEELPLLQRLGRRGMTDPVYAAAWGTALMSQDQAEAALPLLRRAVADSVVGRNPLLHYEIGLGYAQQQRFVAAKGAFQNALALDPGYYEAWIKLAGACAMTGDPAGRDLALARAAALPQAQPAVIAELRKQLSAMSAKPR
jgi:predicted Zn-dependent protease